MITMMKNWKGSFDINGQVYDSFDQIPANLVFSGDWHIKLLPKHKNSNLSRNSAPEVMDNELKEVRITVKQYMTRKATPEFDFMRKWNNDNPMPLCTMTGVVTKQTPGMVYMKLHGDMYADTFTTCLCCGKKLTNPISKYVGMGPECGKVIHMSLTEEDMANIEEVAKEAKKRLQEVKWEGWIIRSAIKERTEL